MTLVLDASVAICWLMPDEKEPAADAILSKLAAEDAVVPTIWWYEVRNALVVNERRGRINAERSKAALTLLAKLPITMDGTPNEDRIMDLARKHRLSAYDAAYVEVAYRREFDLATFDSAMAKAANHEGIALSISSSAP